MAILRFFGSKPQPILALFLSLTISTLTGIVEETTFRGQLFPSLTNNPIWGDGNVLIGMALSSFVLAFLHTNPKAFLPNLLNGGDKEAFLDNLVLLIFQFINGTIFATLYVLSGYNLVVPIISHSLYDTYTLYKTHMVDVAGQMEYAQQQTVRRRRGNSTLMTNKDNNIISSPIEQKWMETKGQRFVEEVTRAFYLMDTNRDGVVSVKEMKIALYSYGIRLSSTQWNQIQTTIDIDQSNDIDLEEFLEFIGPTTGKDMTQAVRYTLFGPIL